MLFRSRKPASASVHSLPPELLHAIFGHLEHFTHSTLCACVSTCRLWYEVARPHLWSLAVFRGSGAQDKLYVFSLSNPDITPFVKELRLLGNGEVPLDVKRLASTLHIFPALQTLSLVAFDNRYTHSTDMYEVSRDKPIPLRKLSINSCSPGTLTLSALLCLFSIDTLELYLRSDQTIDSNSISTVSSSMLHSVDLRHIFVEGASMFAMYVNPVFTPLLRPGTLQSFSGVLWYHHGTMCVHDFLRSAAARSLSRLSLQISISPYSNSSGQVHLGTHRDSLFLISVCSLSDRPRTVYPAPQTICSHS